MRPTLIALTILSLTVLFGTSILLDPTASVSRSEQVTPTEGPGRHPASTPRSEGPLADRAPRNELTTTEANATLAASDGHRVTTSIPGSLSLIHPPVLLFSDTGINPYHIDFRLPAGFDAHLHPGYYPEEAVLLEITLDASSLAEALAKDQETWDAVERDRLYAFNGTRIIGAIHSGQMACPYYCDPPILDANGHGTLVASAAAGRTAGACPDCRIVMHSSTSSERFFGWALRYPWIDALSLSVSAWGGIGFPTSDFEEGSKAWWTSGRSTFTSAGNGPPGTYVNHLDQYTGPPWIVQVGRGDPPRVQWTQTFTVVGTSDLPVAEHDSLDGHFRGSGTSVAAPAVAGHHLRLLWEVRQWFGDTEGVRDGVLAQTTDPSKIPAKGPLSDGVLTSEELETVLRSAARDTVPPYPLPHELSYLWQGYGLVDLEAVAHARNILFGGEDPPQKPWADWWRENDSYARWAWGGTIAPCKNAYQDTVSCIQDSPWDPTKTPGTPPL